MSIRKEVKGFGMPWEDQVRKEAYGLEKPEVASTILVTPRLAFPTQLIEIKFIAKLG